jgi:acyl-CoA hydrolase
MVYRTRKLIKPEDLNPRGTLFGGRLLEFIDEEAAIFAICQLGSSNIVTKIMSEVNFISPAHLGEIIEFAMELVNFGKTSVTIRCEVRNKHTLDIITSVDKIVFVLVDENGKPTPHGKH